MYEYICVEGNIGAGKTTIARMLSESLNAKLVLEAFEENPFLPIFYKDPERFAFPVELHFLMERHRQLKEELSNLNLFTNAIIADYSPQKSLIFARQTLEDREFRLFQGLYNELLHHLRKPDIIVFINRPKEWLTKSIRNRGRVYEMDIQIDYLNKVQQSYLSTFHTVQNIPIIWLETHHINFIEDAHSFGRLQELLKRSDLKSGINFMELEA